MSHLLPLDPQGQGTCDIEALASYFNRLATLHSVSVYQLASHLFEWTGIEGFRVGNRSNCIGPYSLLMNASAESAQCAVRWLEQGLDRRDISVMTMLIFRDVLPPKGPSAHRQHRAWCPACFVEMRQAGLPVYEKLYWSIKSISRCHIHKIALEDECPSCAAKQLDYGRLVPISICRYCTCDLVSSPAQWRLNPQSSIGESDMLEIIGSRMAMQGQRYNRSAPHEFLTEYKRVRNRQYRPTSPDGKPLMRFDYKRTQPSFTTLLNLAAMTEVPLRLILEAPFEAAHIASLSPGISVRPAITPRAFRTKGKRLLVKEALERALSDTDPAGPKPLKALCREFEINTSTAMEWYPDLASDLVRHYAKALSERNRQRDEFVRSVIREMVIPCYRAGKFRTWRQAIAHTRSHHKLPFRLLRRELRNQLGDLRGSLNRQEGNMRGAREG